MGRSLRCRSDPRLARATARKTLTAFRKFLRGLRAQHSVPPQSPYARLARQRRAVFFQVARSSAGSVLCPVSQLSIKSRIFCKLKRRVTFDLTGFANARAPNFFSGAELPVQLRSSEARVMLRATFQVHESTQGAFHVGHLIVHLCERKPASLVLECQVIFIVILQHCRTPGGFSTQRVR